MNTRTALCRSAAYTFSGAVTGAAICSVGILMVPYATPDRYQIANAAYVGSAAAVGGHLSKAIYSFRKRDEGGSTTAQTIKSYVDDAYGVALIAPIAIGLTRGLIDAMGWSDDRWPGAGQMISASILGTGFFLGVTGVVVSAARGCQNSYRSARVSVEMNTLPADASRV